MLSIILYHTPGNKMNIKNISAELERKTKKNKGRYITLSLNAKLPTNAPVFIHNTAFPGRFAVVFIRLEVAVQISEKISLHT